jgi:hypothetical protein
MWYNLFLEQRLAEERMRDALRKAEQSRLIRTAKGAGAADQAALHGLLIRIRNLGLPLISAHRIQPKQDEVIGQPI